MPWWTSPAGIHFAFLLPIMLLIASIGDSSYSGLTIRGIRFLNSDYLLLGCMVLIVSGVAGWIGSFVQLSGPAPDRPREELWDLPAFIVGGLAFGAYFVWFKDFFLHPVLLLHTFQGTYRPDRTNIELTTGITSFANVAPVFFSIYAYRLVVGRAPVSRTLHVFCAMMIALTIFRVYAWSERLAMIEAAVPFGLVLFVKLARARAPFLQLISWLGPIILLPSLILYFAVSEYVRSWQFSGYNKRYGFWEFAVGRLASYYYTSLNNGAGVLATSTWPTMKYENVLSWLHRAPFVGKYFSKMVNLQYAQLDEFLTKFGDPEFNSPSGVFSVFYDLGLSLGFVYFLIVAFLGGMAYRAYRSGKLVGVLFYPMYFVAFLEVFRAPYLGTSRAFMWTLGVFLSLLIVAIMGMRQRVFDAPNASAHPSR